jgi:hypothetical protein
MVKPSYHADVDYTPISEEERKYKSSRELYTIFYLTQNRGLTDLEIYHIAKDLKFTGFDGSAPEAIVRSNIYRWNDMVITAALGDIRCPETGCTKKCIYGYERHKPLRCEKHKLEDMMRIVEVRLVKHPKKPGESKGRFYFDENFAKRVFSSSATTNKSTFGETTIAPASIHIRPPHPISNISDGCSTSTVYPEYQLGNDENIIKDNRFYDLNIENDASMQSPFDPYYDPYMPTSSLGFPSMEVMMQRCYHMWMQTMQWMYPMMMMMPYNMMQYMGQTQDTMMHQYPMQQPRLRCSPHPMKPSSARHQPYMQLPNSSSANHLQGVKEQTFRPCLGTNSSNFNESSLAAHSDEARTRQGILIEKPTQGTEEHDTVTGDKMGDDDAAFEKILADISGDAGLEMDIPFVGNPLINQMPTTGEDLLEFDDIFTTNM